MVSGEPLSKLAYEYLTEAFEGLAQVFPGLEVEKPRCGECFGPHTTGGRRRWLHLPFLPRENNCDAAHDAQP